MSSVRQSCRKQSRPQGFTLIEAIVAIMLFSIMMIGTISALPMAWQTVHRARERLYVAKILEARMEEIRNLTFEELQALPPEFSFTVSPATMVFGIPINPSISDQRFRMRLVEARGTVYVDDVATNWKKVTIRVSWRAAGGRNFLSESLCSYIVKYGVGRR